MTKFLFFLNFLVLTTTAVAQTSLIPFNSTWKYLDNGTNQGTAWAASAFSDQTWKTGDGKFGYGINDAKTIISFGSNAKKKFVTTYFRKTLTNLDPASFTAFTGHIKRDDGAVIYVNGVEVYRSNLPVGTISYNTLATSATDQGKTEQAFSIAPSAFVKGTNVIAVEIHQEKLNTTDMAFDLALSGNLPAMDLTPPAVTSINRQSPSTTLVEAGNVTYRTTFTEAVTSVSPDDFTIYSTGSANGEITSLAPVSASVYDVTVLASGEGDLRLDLKSNETGIADLAGNSITTGFTNGQNYTLQPPPPSDATAPTVVSILRQNPLSEVTYATTLTFRITFSEAVVGVDKQDFSLSTTSTATGVLGTLIHVSSSIFDITVTNASGEGSLRLDLNSSGTGILDAAGNALASGYDLGQAYYVQPKDTSNPTHDELFSFGASWKYLDNGSDQGAAWKTPNFDDDTWKTGHGKFGYGITDAATTIQYGSSATSKYITTYFRKTVTLSQPLEYGTFNFNIKMDDGAVVYVNGTEVYRYNMPTGPIASTTLASLSSSGDGTKIQTFYVNNAIFVAGDNVIAVEIHQQKASSSDMAFDLDFSSSHKTPVMLYYEGFENGTGFAGMHMQTSTTYGFVVETDTVYSGTKAGRWELRAGDPIVADGARAEVLFSESYAHEETWHSYAAYFPSANYLLDSDDEAFNQWHQGGDLGSPLLTLRTQNGRFEVRRRSADGTILNINVLGPIIYDQWIGMVIHVKQHLTDGFMKVWINGELRLDIKDLPTMYNGRIGKWKMGIYKSDWTKKGVTDSKKRVWFVDEVKIGNAANTYESMRPTTNLSVPVLQTSSASSIPMDVPLNLRDKLYPNPAKEGSMVTLELADSDWREVKVTDATGRVVYTTRIKGNGQIDTRNLPSGMYTIHASSGPAISKLKLLMVK
ncbi:heparin lyase I family protein [Nibribacter koreensis]|uniref:Secretion system C-terminal sorting domain-containing protein n=1 Tax=Nibribacter koreensis TaxID=1084519 RepID=A0ABP8FBZ5_9BACT